MFQSLHARLMRHSVSLRKSVRHNSAMLIIHPHIMKYKSTCTSTLAGNCISAQCSGPSNVDLPTSFKVSAKLQPNLYPLMWQPSLPLQLQGEVWFLFCSMPLTCYEKNPVISVASSIQGYKARIQIFLISVIQQALKKLLRCWDYHSYARSWRTQLKNMWNYQQQKNLKALEITKVEH